MTYFSERLNKNVFFKFKAITLSESSVDLLIGRETIRESNIFFEIPSQLSATTIVYRAATSKIPQRVIVSGLLASLVVQLAMPQSVNMRLMPFHPGYRIGQIRNQMTQYPRYIYSGVLSLKA